jgi:hypothetical protein
MKKVGEKYEYERITRTKQNMDNAEKGYSWKLFSSLLLANQSIIEYFSKQFSMGLDALLRPQK